MCIRDSGTVKHFLGHGGTSGDSHDGAVSTDKTLEELMAEELVPFQSAIDGGVNFVMVGHISAPNVTGDNAPATLSKVLITDVLRGQMGYNGIVITDAMNMEAITGFYNSDKAAVLAVTAGADTVSYKHLTLPTNREVEISEVAVSLKKKNNKRKTKKKKK